MYILNNIFTTQKLKINKNIIIIIIIIILADFSHFNLTNYIIKNIKVIKLTAKDRRGEMSSVKIIFSINLTLRHCC